VLEIEKILTAASLVQPVQAGCRVTILGVAAMALGMKIHAAGSLLPIILIASLVAGCKGGKAMRQSLLDGEMKSVWTLLAAGDCRA
jgi:hypothetical protein